MQLFHFWSRDVHPVQNLLLRTKFHENRLIYYWDMAICRFPKWRPSTTLELFYHHTRPPTKSLLLSAAAVKFHVNVIHRSEDTAIWIFRIFGLKCPPKSKMGVLGDFGPLNVIIHHRDPEKAHPCVNPRLLINCKNPLRGLTCRRVDRKCDGHTHTHTHMYKVLSEHSNLNMWSEHLLYTAVSPCTREIGKSFFLHNEPWISGSSIVAALQHCN